MRSDAFIHRSRPLLRPPSQPHAALDDFDHLVEFGHVGEIDGVVAEHRVERVACEVAVVVLCGDLLDGDALGAVHDDIVPVACAAEPWQPQVACHAACEDAVAVAE